MTAALLRPGVESVADGRVTVRLAVDPARMRTSDVPGLASRALDGLPLMVGHACDNADGRSTREEFQDTEVAHVVEHVAIELLSRVAPVRGLRGETAWDFAADGQGVFRVTVHHPDTACAAVALREACRLVEDWSRGRARGVAAAFAAMRETRAG